MSDFTVQLKPSADEIAKLLQSIPGAAQPAVRLSIGDALRSGRSLLASSSGIRERYNLPLSPLLAALGTPRVSGPYGVLNIEGKRIPLSVFPHSFSSVGARVEILKGHPVYLHHAFQAGDLEGIYERDTGVGRYPIHPMVGVSIPQMAGQKEVAAKATQRINEQLNKRMQHYISAFLKGQIQSFNLKSR